MDWMVSQVKRQFQEICKNVKDNNIMATRVLPYFLQNKKEYLDFILRTLLYKVDTVDVVSTSNSNQCSQDSNTSLARKQLFALV